MKHLFGKYNVIRTITAVFILGLLVYAAQVDFSPLTVQAAGERAGGIKYTANQRGDITIIGNQNVTCPNGYANCTTARAGGAYSNNDFEGHMQNINVLAAGGGASGNTTGDVSSSTYTINSCTAGVCSNTTIFNASTATLNMPAGSEVTWAGLYWVGRVRTVGASARQVLFKPPGMTGYQTLTSSVSDGNSEAYGSFAEVTSLVNSARNGTYLVANIAADINWDVSGGITGGWALVVAYKNDSLPLRNLTLFDGFQKFENETATFPISGFKTPVSGPITASLGVVAWDGDRRGGNDSVSVNGIALTNSSNPLHNVFNSTISSYNSVQAARNPFYDNTLGQDIDIFDASNIITPGSTGATFRIQTGSDAIFVDVLSTVIDIQAPEIKLEKSVVDINGGDAEPGDLLRYTIQATNQGTSVAHKLSITDSIPANAVYVPGSLSIKEGSNMGRKTDVAADDQGDFNDSSKLVTFKLGSGATQATGGDLAVRASTTVAFVVAINSDAVDGTVIRNTAVSTYQDDYAYTYTSQSPEADIALPFKDPGAWLMTSNGDASANGGWSDFKVRSVSVASIPSFITSLAGNDPYYLSTFTEITNGSIVDTLHGSKYKQFLLNYTNTVAKVPSGSESTDYYDYILGLANKQGTAVVTSLSSIPSGSNLNSTVAGLSSTTVNTVLFQDTSNPNYKLTIGQDFSCNNRAVIFVNGSLDIEPDMTNTTTTGTTGCMFVVKKDITVLPGHSAGSGNYDQLQASFITSQAFTTQYDNQEGLLVWGGITANTVSLNRHLGANLNSNRPAEWFMLNPNYITTFGSILSSRHFSIRTQ